MEMYEFRLKFYLSLFLSQTRRQAIIWTNDSSITDAYMRYPASMS